MGPVCPRAGEEEHVYRYCPGPRPLAFSCWESLGPGQGSGMAAVLGGVASRSLDQTTGVPGASGEPIAPLDWLAALSLPPAAFSIRASAVTSPRVVGQLRQDFLPSSLFLPHPFRTLSPLAAETPHLLCLTLLETSGVARAGEHISVWSSLCLSQLPQQAEVG